MSEHEETGADDGAVSTVRERLRAAGMSDERVRSQLEARAIALDGNLVTDLDTPASRPGSTSWRACPARDR